MQITVDESQSGLRVDKFLALCDSLTRSYIQRLIDENRLKINGKISKSNQKLKSGDIVELDVPDVVPLDAESEDIPLDIVYEDDQLLIVNKSQGMVVHPASGNFSGTLVNALLYHCNGNLSGINGVARPGIVHRIDKDTSGLLLVAKTNEAHLSLAAQIKAHTLTRKYIALVHGRLKNPEGTIDAPIGRSPKDRKKMCVTHTNSKQAVTHYKVTEDFGTYNLVECRLETGRTHQIRVHMSYIGHPVVGDPVYGIKKEAFKTGGQLLHAATLGFIHPLIGEYIEINCPLPQYYEKILEQLHKKINLM